MRQLEKRLARLEAQVRREEDDKANAFDPDPTAYRLLVWHRPEESAEDALARWGLTRAAIPTGVTVHLFRRLDPCPDPPWLAYHRRSSQPIKATKSDMGAYVQQLQEALHRFETMPRDAYDAHRAQQQAARWERAQQTLRQWAEHRGREEAAGILPAARS
jgi:hypothetical protein